MGANVASGQGDGMVYCSQCRQPSTTRANYCPHCGARMNADPVAASGAPSYHGQQSTILPANYLPASTGQRARPLLPDQPLTLDLYGKNKVVGLLLTFFFPFFGFLYSTNYIWAVFALLIDVVNLLLVLVLGFGLFTGLLWRLLALVIANYGIDRYRRRKLRESGYQV